MKTRSRILAGLVAGSFMAGSVMAAEVNWLSKEITEEKAGMVSYGQTKEEVISQLGRPALAGHIPGNPQGESLVYEVTPAAGSSIGDAQLYVELDPSGRVKNSVLVEQDSD
ncbi:hypothetical protein [Uliginosibacterium sp. H1]|uniref:hypothetical protein n=1 Tax=Uliginosibacterium sp. H1 TaxID=3114757 RepID=UPI002E192A0F|nr:hypothetical protein [Uliginosibacterium sp. H1]